jgi:hypothetical protein
MQAIQEQVYNTDAMKSAYTIETIDAACKVPINTVSGRAHHLGMSNREPLIVAMDAMIRYAKAHQRRFGDKLCEDYFLGPLWLDTVKGVRGLLNGDGAIAHERGVATDSKDNGAVEEMFWSALGIAGFKESDL